MFIKSAVCIMGPTCIGKTDLSIKLLDYFPFEIVSVDSCMIYKYMDIGTGKPSSYLLNKVKHHLIDVCDPVDIYTVFDFCRDSFFIMQYCWNKGKIPLFVGGSMMYFWALYCCFSFYRYVYYFDLLDSIFKKKIFINDMMFFKLINLKFFNIAVVPVDKYRLYNRIEKRFYRMLKCGFIDEVYYLYCNKNLNFKCKSIKSIGYKDLWLYFDGKTSLSDAKKSILRSTIDLSNRQLCWLKKWKDDLIFIEDGKKGMLSYLLNLVSRYVF